MARRFAVRFAVSLVVLGGLYVTVVGFTPRSHNKPQTPNQQLASLRSQLDSILITTASLARFHQSDAVAYANLSQLTAGLQSASNSVQGLLHKNPRLLTATENDDILRLTTEVKHADQRYQKAQAVFSRVLRYDPSSDLGKQSVSSAGNLIKDRANAAAKGLRAAAGDATSVAATGGELSVGTVNDNAQLVTPAAREALANAAQCFESVANQLASNQPAQADATRSNCIKDYPQLRSVVAGNLLTFAYGPSYQQSIQQRIPPLLKQLDARIKTTH